VEATGQTLSVPGRNTVDKSSSFPEKNHTELDPAYRIESDDPSSRVPRAIARSAWPTGIWIPAPRWAGSTRPG
ncbi:MAG TPA: hypothetical protein VKA15_12235, partial [Isosphaeraceae bacterium]|nr:hypothetical protein [Isosphaeraceae bacterium]